ncbi:MAG: methyltransferase domain-containing protein [Patescibacteria group bacterium]
MELLIIIILLILLLPTAYVSVIGAPIALTDKLVIDKIIKIADVKDGETFYELGTGTGRIITAFAKNKNIKIVGFELSPIFYLITLLNLKLRGVKNYELHYKNFFTADLKEANIVFCFLIPKTMEKLKDKFSKELKSGSKIISYAFEIEGWMPYAKIEENKKLPIYFYKIK